MTDYNHSLRTVEINVEPKRLHLSVGTKTMLVVFFALTLKLRYCRDQQIKQVLQTTQRW